MDPTQLTSTRWRQGESPDTSKQKERLQARCHMAQRKGVNTPNVKVGRS